MITFTKKQLATLRKIAQRATQGEWVAFISPGTDTYAVYTPGDERCGDIIKWPGFDDQKNAENNARYIAAFNPEVVLALLDVLDASLNADPVAWRYRYVKKGVTDFQEKMWVGDWKYVPTKEDCNDRPNYEIQALFIAPPAPIVPAVLERLRTIVADPRALPRRKEWVSGQQYSYVLLENVEAMVDEACRAAMKD